MTIEITKEDRKQAIESIERYFRENMEEKIGNIAAGGLLGFILEEIGPSIYNKAVADVQERLQARVADLDFEIHEDEFAYWKKYDKQRKPKLWSRGLTLRSRRPARKAAQAPQLHVRRLIYGQIST